MAESMVGAQVGAAAGSVVHGAASTGKVRIDPNAVYSLGSSSGESERLQRQADELASENEALLDRVELGPGDSAIDLGCGPRGIIELLHTRVSPGGRVVGLDSDSAHVAMARELVAALGIVTSRFSRVTLGTPVFRLTRSILFTREPSCSTCLSQNRCSPRWSA